MVCSDSNTLCVTVMLCTLNVHNKCIVAACNGVFWQKHILFYGNIVQTERDTKNCTVTVSKGVYWKQHIVCNSKVLHTELA